MKKFIAYILVLLSAGSACTNSRFQIGSLNVAPYQHRIMPVINRFAEDERTLERLIKNNPQSFQTRANLAAQYASEAKLTGDLERFDQAEKLAEHSLSIFKFNNDRATLVLGDVAQARHNFAEAIRIAETVVENKTSKKQAKLEAVSLLVTAELATGHLDKAHAHADLLVDDDDSVANHLIRALVEEMQGRDDEVLYDYQAAYQKETFGNVTESARLRAFWGRYFVRRGDYEKAQNLYHEALRILPGDALTTGFLAELELKQNQFEDADHDFQNAFSQTKSTVYLLGQIRAKRGMKKADAAQDLENQVEKLLRNSLVSATGSNRYAHRNELVKILLNRGSDADLNEALKLANEELSNRRNHETLYLLAQCLEQLGHESQAQVTVEEILRTGIRDAEYFAFASHLAARRHNTALANFYSKQMKEADPHFDLNSVVLRREGNRVAVQ
jgi:tetratricopeptide (TPR) repeat protein